MGGYGSAPGPPHLVKALLKPSRGPLFEALLGIWGAVLEPFWAVLTLFWASWGPGNHVPGEASGDMILDEALLGLPEAVLALSWGRLGSLLSRLRILLGLRRGLLGRYF